jgi:hypothetical protein
MMTSHRLQHGRSCVAAVSALFLLAIGCGDDKLAALPENVELTPTATCPDGTPVGPDGCPFGRIVGHICDRPTGSWIAGAVASITVAQETRTAVTDSAGEFVFDAVPPGAYLVHIDSSAYTNDFWATVTAGQTATIGHTECQPPSQDTGSIQGRICGGDGYWLSGARVFVDLGGGNIVETTTDASGYFTLTGLPAGELTAQATRGAFAVSFQVTVTSGQTTVIPDPICMPPTTRMAVVTGMYDSIQTVLVDLGFPIRNTYNSLTPTVSDPAGNVDIIDGKSSFWIERFLTDPAWVQTYDIIFFNCGIYDSDLEFADASTNAALANLKAFVQGGKSIYVSDWASEVVRLTFPNTINWRGGNGSFGVARVGVENSSLNATVVDGAMATALGKTTVTLNMDLPEWVVMKPVASQPSTLWTFVRADVSVYNDPFGFSSSAQNDTPLLVQFQEQAGRVLYTSFHNESQTTADMENILRYVIFVL